MCATRKKCTTCPAPSPAPMMRATPPLFEVANPLHQESHRPRRGELRARIPPLVIECLTISGKTLIGATLPCWRARNALRTVPEAAALSIFWGRSEDPGTCSTSQMRTGPFSRPTLSTTGSPVTPSESSVRSRALQPPPLVHSDPVDFIPLPTIITKTLSPPSSVSARRIRLHAGTWAGAPEGGVRSGCPD
jgi:hypothetical protein